MYIHQLAFEITSTTILLCILQWQVDMTTLCGVKVDIYFKFTLHFKKILIMVFILPPSSPLTE